MWLEVSFTNNMIEQERLPWNEGWRPTTNRIDGLSTAQVTLQLALNTPEKA